MRKPNAFRCSAFAVPAAYFAGYFALAVPFFGGTWWDASFVFGSIAEAGSRRSLHRTTLPCRSASQPTAGMSYIQAPTSWRLRPSPSISPFATVSDTTATNCILSTARSISPGATSISRRWYRFCMADRAAGLSRVVSARVPRACLWHYRFVRLRYRARAARRRHAQALTALTLALAPGLAGLAYGVSTEILSPAAWTALITSLSGSIKSRDTRWYYAIAAASTVGLYAKYSVALCALAIVMGLLLTGQGRLLRSSNLAIAFAIVVVLLLPNALWEIGHGFPILEVLHNDQLNRHALANGMADESPNRWINALYMLGLQFAYQNPIFSVVWIWGLIYAWQTRAYRFMTVAYLAMLVVLVLTIGRGYYIQGCYPALFAAGAVAISRAIANRRALL